MWEIKRVKLLFSLYTFVPNIDMFAAKNHQILFWLYDKTMSFSPYLCLTISSKKKKEKQQYFRGRMKTILYDMIYLERKTYISHIYT